MADKMFGEKSERDLVKAVTLLAQRIDQFNERQHNEFEWFRSHLKLATKDDLKEMESRIDMKLSEAKALIATAAKQSTEAFSELSTRIADLQKQIQDLIDGAGDPEVTDEAFLADLETLKTNAQQLADIVPNPEPPTP